MKLGLMQPYFFPYIEYFRLLSVCDLWVAFDLAQFSRGGWINRNRILDRSKGWSWLTLPVHRDGLKTPIADARIDCTRDWPAQFSARLKVYEADAPHFSDVRMMIEELPQGQTRLGEYNMTGIRAVCAYLGIQTPIAALSDLDVPAPLQDAPGGWPLHLCRALDADTYINASGGSGLYDPELFAANGVNLIFHEHIDFTYDTGPFEFVPDLSILDAMMWVDRDRLREVVK